MCAYICMWKMSKQSCCVFPKRWHTSPRFFAEGFLEWFLDATAAGLVIPDVGGMAILPLWAEIA